uniref:Uncharacterized protein n=2 Tax=Oryza TaxID=4527 RepID=A0A0E0NKQ2_ORYRU
MAVAKRFVLPLMMVVLLLSAVSGSARPMGGDKWVGMATSGDHPLIQFLQNLYLQQLAQPEMYGLFALTNLASTGIDGLGSDGKAAMHVHRNVYINCIDGQKYLTYGTPESQADCIITLFFPSLFCELRRLSLRMCIKRTGRLTST